MLKQVGEPEEYIKEVEPKTLWGRLKKFFTGKKEYEIWVMTKYQSEGTPETYCYGHEQYQRTVREEEDIKNGKN